jgi:hypothetical protein
MPAHAMDLASTLHGYFETIIWKEGAPCREALDLFKACQMFDPFFLLQEIQNDQNCVSWDMLEGLKIINGIDKKQLDIMASCTILFVSKLKYWQKFNHIQPLIFQGKMSSAWSILDDCESQKRFESMVERSRTSPHIM